MIDPLICARAVVFAATMTAAGAVFFMIFVAEPACAGAKAGASVLSTVRVQSKWIVWTSLGLCIVSGIAWLILTAAAMASRPAAGVFSGNILWTVLSQTEFGNDWLARFVLAVLLAAAVTASLPSSSARPAWLNPVSVLLAAAFAGSLAWSGHAAGGIGLEAVAHPIADILHLIAAAAWVGALIPLALLLGGAARATASLPIARAAVLRFSTLGIASVATLLLTGIINSYYLAGSIAAVIATDYGRLLLVKVALFFAMVAVAAVNRLRLTPRIVEDASPVAVLEAIGHLRRNAAVEAALGAIVIIIVAALGTLPPASHAQHHAAYGSVPADAAFVHIHSRQGMAEVTISPGRAGTANATIHLADEDFGPLDAEAVTLTLTAPTTGSKPTTRIARRDIDGDWQVDGIALAVPGNWAVVVDATLSPNKHLLLDAPIVIDPAQ